MEIATYLDARKDMHNASHPYLSLVMTSRNDEDDSDSIARLQMFSNSLLSQLENHKLDSELILVEWNPPKDRERLSELIQWPRNLRFCNVRIIKVPAKIHGRFENSESIPLFQMIAKNVGIRRARGRFVLATNIDILFSNELAEFLAAQILDPHRMYRINRHDVPFENSIQMSVDERLEWCHNHILRIYRYSETVETVNDVIPLAKAAKNLGLKGTIDNLLRRERPLHTNACGDFTLLSAEYWEKVRGYPEFPLRAMKLDGLLCYSAHFAGAKQLILQDPMRIYHLDHPARADGALVAISNREMDSTSLQVPWHQYQAWIKEMQRFHKPIIFNGKEWGLIEEDLDETVID